MYSAIVAAIDSITPIEGRDFIVVAEVCGSKVIVSNECKVGDIGIYFPVDGAISQEYGEYNNLFRKKDDQGNNIGGYLELNGRIRCIKFAGIRSDGLFMPVESVKYATKDLVVGQLITTIGKHLICEKYVSKATKNQQQQGKAKRSETIMFQKHIDTDQLLYNLKNLETGKRYIVTAKLHGTSQRVGLVLEERTGFWARVKKFLGLNYKFWTYLNGTRNVILNNGKQDAWYSSGFREKVANVFEDKLNKGEVVYFEVVGYEPNGSPIMGSVSIKDLEKEKQDQYSINTGVLSNGSLVYTYGCLPGEFKVFIYRICLVNEDGFSIDYSWEDVKLRAKQMGVDHVPELDSFTYDGDQEKLKEYVQQFEDHDDFIDNTHPLEGICIRKDVGLKVQIYKWKTYQFKLLEGIIKSNDSYVDTEEAS